MHDFLTLTHLKFTVTCCFLLNGDLENHKGRFKPNVHEIRMQELLIEGVNVQCITDSSSL